MRIFLAPMVGRTDRYFRRLVRIISPNITLFTEMITVDSLLRGKRSIHEVDEREHPIVIQLAGDDERKMIECSKISQDLGYDEVNLNVGCPSTKVVKGGFGACQINEPNKIANFVKSIKNSCDVPISIKTRLGLGYDHDLDAIKDFINQTSDAGCKIFYIHARNAILNGLSTRKNRSVPPLRYNDVSILKKEFPNVEIYINGGFESMTSIKNISTTFDGIMIGRKVYGDPMFLIKLEKSFFSEQYDKSREQIINEYLETLNKKDISNKRFVMRHLTNLYFKTNLSKKWKRYIHFISNSKNPITDLKYFPKEDTYETKKVISS